MLCFDLRIFVSGINSGRKVFPKKKSRHVKRKKKVFNKVQCHQQSDNSRKFLTPKLHTSKSIASCVFVTLAHKINNEATGSMINTSRFQSFPFVYQSFPLVYQSFLLVYQSFSLVSLVLLVCHSFPSGYIVST